MNARSTAFEFTCLGKRINDIVSAVLHSVMFNRCVGKFNYKHPNSLAIGSLGFEEVICDFIDFTYIRVSSCDLIKHVNQCIKCFVDDLRLLSQDNQQQSNRLPKTSFPSQGVIATSPTVPIPIVRPRPSSLFDPQYYHHNTDSPLHHSTSPASTAYEALISPSLYTAATGSISLEFVLKNSRPFSFAADPLVWEVWTLKINCLKDEANESLFNKIPIEDQLSDKIFSIVQLINNENAFLPDSLNKDDLENVFDTSYSNVQPYNFKISHKIGRSSDFRSGSIGSLKTGLLGSGQTLKKLYNQFVL